MSTVAKDVGQAGGFALSMARLVASNTDEFIADTESLLTQMVQRPDIRAMDRASCPGIIADLTSLNRNYADAGIVDLSGQPICIGSRSAAFSDHPSMAQTEWFQRIIRDKKTIIGKPYMGLITKSWVIVAASPIRDDRGEMIGVFALPIQLSHFQSVRNGAISDGGWVTIVDNEGTVIARSEDAENWVGTNRKSSAIVQTALSAGEGTSRGVGSTGVERAFGFTTLKETDWHVIVGVPIDNILAPVRDIYMQDGLIVAVLTLLVLALAFLISRGIALPLGDIQAASRAAADGALDTRLQIRGPREICDVAAQFNRMLEVRQKAEAALVRSEARFRGLLESAPDGNLLVDAKGCILLVNDKAEQMFGWPRADLLGKPIETLVPHRGGDHAALRRDYMHSPHVREMGAGLDLSARRQDGSEFPVEVMLTPMQTEDGMIVSAMIRDVTGRKAAEAEIRAAQQFSERLIDTANVIVVGLDAQGHVQIFNNVAESVTGYSKEEMIGRNWLETGIEKTRYPQIWEQGPPCHASGIIAESSENPIIGKDGREHIIAWRNTFFPPGGKLTSVSFGLDITDQRRNEAVIDSLVQNTSGRTGQDYFDSLVAWLCDWVGADASLLARLAENGQADIVAGRLDGQPLDLSYDVAGTPCERLLEQGFLHQADNLQNVFPSDPRLDRFNLQGFFGVPVVNTHGKALGVLSVWSHSRLALPPRAKEIMELMGARAASELERLAAEDRVREVLDLNQKIISETSSGIIAYKASGQCIHANPAAARIVGGSMELLLEQNFTQLASWRASGLYDAALEALQSEESVRRQLLVDSSFGRSIWLDCNFSIFTMAEEPHLLLVIDDITERHQVEQLMLDTKRAAEDASRAKGEFLANMSHEIRTPMNAIFGLSHLALRADPPPRQRDYLEKIHSSAYALLGIINDVLDFSKIEAGKFDMEAVDFQLHDIMAMVTEMVGLQAEQKGLELVLSAAADVPANLIGDGMRLRQVLLNLTSNAVKFTDKGEVIVGVELVEQSADAVILKFKVCDSGIGISSEQQAKLFQAFTQADGSTTRRFGGTGLGLAISKRLVEMMDGAIGVDSEVGRGSTFWFTARFQLQDTQQPAIPPSSAIDLSGLNILVVDDSAASREVLSEFLRAMSFDVAACDSGEQALIELERASKSEDWYDLVLLDWKMPGLDGLETARLIRQNSDLPHLPTIFMVTAYDRSELISQAESIGLDGVLTKPVTPSILLDAIMNVFGCKLVEPAAAKTFQPGTAIQDRRVLVVEDNEINRQVAREMLEEYGVQVTTADNGAEAVKILRETPDLFDAVLMDVQMPVMDGLEATRALRRDSRFADLPIIAMTAHVFDEDRRRCADAGMTDYVAKPINPRHLHKALALALHRDMPKSEPAALETLPHRLPGLDSETALQRVAGKLDVYGRLLDAFTRDWGCAAKQLEQLISRGDWDHARRTAHTLKGVAGNLGAVAVAALAADVEMAALRRDPASHDLLKPLEEALTEVLQSMAAFPRQASETAAGPSSTDPERAKASIDRLTEMLSNNDFAAGDEVEVLIQALDPRTFGPDIAALKEKIEALDFMSGQRLLNELAARLHHDAL